MFFSLFLIKSLRFSFLYNRIFYQYFFVCISTLFVVYNYFPRLLYIYLLNFDVLNCNRGIFYFQLEVRINFVGKTFFFCLFVFVEILKTKSITHCMHSKCAHFYCMAEFDLSFVMDIFVYVPFHMHDFDSFRSLRNSSSVDRTGSFLFLFSFTLTVFHTHEKKTSLTHIYTK